MVWAKPFSDGLIAAGRFFRRQQGSNQLLRAVQAVYLLPDARLRVGQFAAQLAAKVLRFVIQAVAQEGDVFQGEAGAVEHDGFADEADVPFVVFPIAAWRARGNEYACAFVKTQHPHADTAAAGKFADFHIDPDIVSLCKVMLYSPCLPLTTERRALPERQVSIVNNMIRSIKMNRRRFCAAAGAGVLLAGCKSLPKPDGGPVRVFIIHGYGATVADHWFPWLAQQLRRRGMEVVPVPLPDSLHPDYGRWQDALARTVGMPSGRTVLVAHSLGTVSLLHYLSRIRPHKIGGLVLVSAFGARIPTLPQINGFDVDGYVDRCPIDFAAVRRMTDRIALFTADNDNIVPPENTRRLARQLGGKPEEITGGGHFLGSDGFTEFPQVLRAIERMAAEIG